jgi:hypothetical protein
MEGAAIDDGNDDIFSFEGSDWTLEETDSHTNCGNAQGNGSNSTNVLLLEVPKQIIFGHNLA